jgi:hypothetical protein
MADAPAAPPDPLAAGADRIRKTAQWMIGAFAAVGAALIAGTQLSSIGALDGWRLALAFLAVPLALAGVALAVWAAAAVAQMSRVSLVELAAPAGAAPGKRRWLFPDLRTEPTRRVRSEVATDATYLAGYRDVTTLKDEYVDAVRRQREAAREYYAAPQDANKIDALNRVQAEVDSLDVYVQRLLGIASFERLGVGYGLAQRYMLYGAAVAAMGIVLFTYAANPNTDEEEEAAPAELALKQPTEVAVKLTPVGQRLVGGRLGQQCQLGSLRAVVIGGDEKRSELVTLPEAGCKSVRLTLPTRLGTVALPRRPPRLEPTGG